MQGFWQNDHWIPRRCVPAIPPEPWSPLVQQQEVKRAVSRCQAEGVRFATLGDSQMRNLVEYFARVINVAEDGRCTFPARQACVTLCSWSAKKYPEFPEKIRRTVGENKALSNLLGFTPTHLECMCCGGPFAEFSCPGGQVALGGPCMSSAGVGLNTRYECVLGYDCVGFEEGRTLGTCQKVKAAGACKGAEGACKGA